MFTPGIDEAQCVDGERGFTYARFCKLHMFTLSIISVTSVVNETQYVSRERGFTY